jgi:hypothetical protein
VNKEETLHPIVDKTHLGVDKKAKNNMDDLSGNTYSILFPVTPENLSIFNRKMHVKQPPVVVVESSDSKDCQPSTHFPEPVSLKVSDDTCKEDDEPGWSTSTTSKHSQLRS